MGSKRTHKLRAMGDVQVVINRTPDLTAAARELGVDRSTITRWLQTGKITAKTGAALREGKTAPPPPTPADWREWAAAVRDAYTLSATDHQLVALAEMALQLAHSSDDKPMVHLAAMARFAALVRQLNLQQAAPVTSSAPAVPTRPGVPVRSVTRSTADPRVLLMAVK